MNPVNQPPTPQSFPTERRAARRLRLGDLLQAQGLINEQQIQEALAYQKSQGGKRLLGEVIIELGFATEDQIMETLAKAYGVPFARLSVQTSDQAIFDVLPEEFCEKNLVVPLFLVEGRLTIGMHEPSNVFLIEEIERKCGHRVQVVAAREQDLRELIQLHKAGDTESAIDDLVDSVDDNDLAVVEAEMADLSEAITDGDESPVIKLVNAIVLSAVQDGASDIHIEPDEGEMRVRFRVDGRLYEKMRPPHRMAPAVASRIKIMAGMDISERRQPQDGAISVNISKRRIDLRVSTIPGKFGEKTVMRIIDRSQDSATLDMLGLPDQLRARWEDMIKLPNGIILVTGPTGSGKSTTLYATLAQISDDAVNISTVEDPVEYNLKGVNQFQTNNKAGFTFASALRSLLRQDPDIVMVGEIRDKETAGISIQAALTGHLVFSTLHTNDAPSAVTRLFNIGVEPYLVAASVKAVLAQRLVRRLCPNCKAMAVPEKSLIKALQNMRPDLEPPGEVGKGVGCQKCRTTGFKGRLGLYELFTPDEAALEAVANGATLAQVRKSTGPETYTTLLDDGVAKVAQGMTTLEEVFGVATA